MRAAGMADRHTKKQRSYNMSRIRKFGNKTTEIRMIALFQAYGIKGWRRHLPLPGRPDFTFRRARVVVFVDGCFWHGCPRCNWTPTSNTKYWSSKLVGNRAKDRDANRALRRSGWTVVRIWEHSLKHPARVMARIRRALGDGSKAVDDSA
jgi:DNA mismatch endonuclease (patch repair protein)